MSSRLAPGAPAAAETSGDLRTQRHIEQAQAARRARIRAAARELASQGGYAAVTMHDVAERAGVGRATVYRYYSSKDHLIADVHLEQSSAIVAGLEADPARGSTPAERLADVCGRIVDMAAADLRLTEAGVTLALSDDPAIASAQAWRSNLVLPYVEMAVTASDGVDRETVAEVLQAVLFQALLGLARERSTPDEAKALLSRAAHLLLDR
jgi:AcrR family transcriptional regulator